MGIDKRIIKAVTTLFLAALCVYASMWVPALGHIGWPVFIWMLLYLLMGYFTKRYDVRICVVCLMLALVVYGALYATGFPHTTAEEVFYRCIR